MRKYETLNGEITKEEYNRIMKDNDRYLENASNGKLEDLLNITFIFSCDFLFSYDDEKEEKWFE